MPDRSRDLFDALTNGYRQALYTELFKMTPIFFGVVLLLFGLLLLLIIVIFLLQQLNPYRVPKELEKEKV